MKQHEMDFKGKMTLQPFDKQSSTNLHTIKGPRCQNEPKHDEISWLRTNGLGVEPLELLGWITLILKC